MRWCGWLLVLAACGGGSGGAGGGVGSGSADTGAPVDPVPLDSSDHTYRLTESSDALTLWTTSATHRLTLGDRAPDAESSGLFLSAARNEFEPELLALGPATGTATVSIEPFPDLGAGARVELSVVNYEDGWGERLDANGPITLRDDAAMGVWLSVYVPGDAPAGEHTTTLSIDHDGTKIDVPVTLYVFDFVLPPEVHFATQLNLDVSSLVPDGGAVDDAKAMLLEHRFTPKSVTWPSGFNWGITWDNGNSPERCEALWDEPDEPDEYSIGWLARRYILGEGWGGVGFPNAMLFQFVDNGTPRPESFCGVARGDHYGTADYNAEWQQFLGALQGYLASAGMLDKAYVYVQNEPQDAVDHALAAHLCRVYKQGAPDLRIAVSEEPTPAIAEDPGGACGYDIWIAHAPAYQEDYAWQRQRDHGEEVWFYSLDQDADPYFNPTAADRQGIHARVIPWAAWSHRIRGWAYYDMNRFFDGPRPGVRAELFREGFEDYEYLWLANDGGHPSVDAAAIPDPTAKSIATSMTSWNKDPDALMTLRHELGLYLEGKRDTLPVLETESDRPRDAYYINFQDPDGQPLEEPLVVDGHEYIKVGWMPWDDALGYGFYGENVGDPGIALYGYDETTAFSEVERSYIYDDYGRPSLFEFSLAPGQYEVTVGVGNPARGYPGDPHNVKVEGQVLVDDEVTTDGEPLIIRTITVTLSDGLLSLEFGGRSETTGDFAYTFLGFMNVEPV